MVALIANNMCTEVKKKELDLSYKYNFPTKLEIIRYKGSIIIISIETANWIILNNEKQLLFFNLLKDLPINKALERFNGLKEDYEQVLIQIEAKHFEDRTVTLSSVGKKKLHFYLTNGCNMQCPHCYMFAGKKESKELSTNEIKDILHKFKKYGGEQVTFSGGEITTRADICEIIEYASELNLEILLLTNGVLWTEEQISKISSLIYSVQVSIDGFSEEENSKIRGKGNFNKALQTVDSFLKKGVRTEIAITPFYSEDLKNNYLKYSLFGKELLEKYVDYNLSIRFSSDLIDGRDVKLSKEDKQIYHNIVENIISDFYGINAKTFPFISVNKDRQIHDNCSFGELAISAEGDVYFCSRIPSLHTDINIRKDSFDEIIKISHVAANLSDVNNLQPCNECELKYICGGDCRIEHFPEFSNLTITELSQTSIKPRMCSSEIKNHFYDLMILTNEDLFS